MHAYGATTPEMREIFIINENQRNNHSNRFDCSTTIQDHSAKRYRAVLQTICICRNYVELIWDNRQSSMIQNYLCFTFLKQKSLQKLKQHLLFHTAWLSKRQNFVYLRQLESKLTEDIYYHGKREDLIFQLLSAPAF